MAKVKVAKEDKDWVAYFTRIRKVCPWSYKLMDKILIWENHENCVNTTINIFPKTKFEAFVYTMREKTPKQLQKLCDVLNSTYTHSEFLWSHPEEGGDSTHLPVLIQQDRTKLEELRQAVGYNG